MSSSSTSQKTRGGLHNLMLFSLLLVMLLSACVAATSNTNDDDATIFVTDHGHVLERGGSPPLPLDEKEHYLVERPPSYRREFEFQLKSKIWDERPDNFLWKLVLERLKEIWNHIPNNVELVQQRHCSSSWWKKLWNYWYCTNIIMVIDLKPHTAKEYKHLEEIVDNEIIALVTELQEQYEDQFSLTWISRPHIPNHFVELNYVFGLTEDQGGDDEKAPESSSAQHTMLEALEVVDDAFYESLLQNGFAASSFACSFYWQNEHDREVGPVYANCEIYYTRQDANNGGRIYRIATEAIERVNKNNDWFYVTVQSSSSSGRLEEQLLTHQGDKDEEPDNNIPTEKIL